MRSRATSVDATSRALTPERAAFTALRVVIGAIMAAHGWHKLNNFQQWQDNVQNLSLPYPHLMAPLAMIAELLGGVGLIIGFLTPIAAFSVASVLAVAIFSVHWSHGLFASKGGFEFPLTLLVAASDPPPFNP